MERCSYCRQGHANKFSQIKHKTGCPRVIRAHEGIYQDGWNDGRTGKPAKSKEPAYLMGYSNGECAAEEAENGWRPY